MRKAAANSPAPLHCQTTVSLSASSNAAGGKENASPYYGRKRCARSGKIFFIELGAGAYAETENHLWERQLQILVSLCATGQPPSCAADSECRRQEKECLSLFIEENAIPESDEIFLLRREPAHTRRLQITYADGRHKST